MRYDKRLIENYTLKEFLIFGFDLFSQQLKPRLITTIALALILFFSQIIITPQEAMAAQPSVVLSGVKGEVLVKKGGGLRELPATNGMELVQGDWLRTGKNGTAKLSYDDGTEATIGSNSSLTIQRLSRSGSSGASAPSEAQVTFSENGQQSSVQLRSGSIWSKVKSLFNVDDSYEVETPTAVMGVRGTLYLVSVNPENGATQGDVIEGVVGVTQNNEATQSAPIQLVTMGQTLRLVSLEQPMPAHQVIDPQELIRSTQAELLVQLVNDIMERAKELTVLTQEQQLAYEQTGVVDDLKVAIGTSFRVDELANFGKEFMTSLTTSDKLEQVKQVLKENNQSIEQLQSTIDTMKKETEEIRSEVIKAAEEAGVSEAEIESIGKEAAGIPPTPDSVTPPSTQPTKPTPPAPSTPPTSTKPPSSGSNGGNSSNSGITTVTSNVYTVGSGTIQNVPYGTSLTTFLGKVLKGESHQTWDTSGVHDPVQSNDRIVVTAEDGTKATYIIAVSPVPAAPLGTPVPISQGEPITFTNGVSLDFGDLDIPTGTTVKVEEVSPEDLPEGSEVAGKVVKFTFDGLTVNDSVSLTLPIDSDADPTKAGIFYLNDLEEWEYQNSTVLDGKVFATVNHFSTYGVLAPKGIVNLVSQSMVSDGTQVRLMFDKSLFNQSIPSVEDFLVTHKGAPIGVTNVSLDYDSIILNVDKTIYKNDLVEISYTVGSKHICDSEGNSVQGFVEKSVETDHLEDQPVVTPVSDFACTSKTDTTASFTWASVIGATKIKIEKALTGAGAWTTASTGTISVNAGTATVTGLTGATGYDFRLVVTGGTNAGTSNALVNVVTQAVSTSESLATPSNFSTMGTIVKWDRVDNANSYSVSIYKKGNLDNYSDSTLVTRVVILDKEYLYDLSTYPLSTGTYQVKVTALGDGTNYKDSNESVFSGKSVYLVQMETPTNFSTSGSTVTWDGIENATGYNVSIYRKATQNDYSDAIVVKDVYKGGFEADSETTYSLDLSYYELMAGTYQVKVSAVGYGTNYSVSEKSEFSGTDIELVQQLETPNNLNTTGNEVTWDLVPNAKMYRVDIYKKGIQSDYSDAKLITPLYLCRNDAEDQHSVWSVFDPYGTTASIELSTAWLAAGSYQAKVTALGYGTNFTNSNESVFSGTDITYVALPTPVNFITEDTLITWDQVSNATNYDVNIYKKGLKADYSDSTTGWGVGVAQPSSGTTVSLDLGNYELEAGIYQVRVIAVGYETNYARSDESEFSGTDIIVEPSTSIFEEGYPEVDEATLTESSIDLKVKLNQSGIAYYAMVKIEDSLSLGLVTAEAVKSWDRDSGSHSSISSWSGRIDINAYETVVRTINNYIKGGTTYKLYVVAEDLSGSLTGVSELQVTTPRVIPGTVVGLQATPGDGLVNLSWEGEAGATFYRVYQATTSGGSYTEVDTSVLTNYRVKGLTNGTTYYFVVKACNEAGDGGSSYEVVALPVTAPQDSGDYTYTVTADGKAQITGYTGAGGAISIPDTLGGVPVTSIGESAFKNSTIVTNISIPQGVTSIGFWAFDGCSALISVSLPEGLRNIGDEAFYNCMSLTSLIIPESVTSIGDWAFSGCTGLTDISLPEGVTSISYGAFNNCIDLTSIRFNSATTTIYDYANTIPTATTIIGYDPSTAKAYAAKYGRTFQAIEENGLLPVTLGFGSINGSTKAMFEADNTFTYKHLISNIEPVIPDVDSLVPVDAIVYMSGDDIVASENQWLVIYEVDSSNKVVRYFKKQLTQEDFCMDGDPYEPDNDYNHATLLDVDGEIQTHTIGHLTDEDWFKFEAQVGMAYQIQTLNLVPGLDAESGNPMDTYMYLYDMDGTTLLDSNDDFMGYESSIKWVPPYNGAFYVKIIHYEYNIDEQTPDSVGQYDISVQSSIPLDTVDISGSFTDVNFRQAVWEWLGNSGEPGAFTKQDLCDQMELNWYELYISERDITSLAGLENFEGTGLMWLSCHSNQLGSLPELPTTLEGLACGYNKLSSLPELPTSLEELYCYDNQLSRLPELPSTLTSLACGYNKLSRLPELPTSLQGLHCYENQLSILPELPSTLRFLECGSNKLSNLPELPTSLEELYCNDNQLSNLPSLPTTLRDLSCDYNYLNIYSDPLKTVLNNCSASYMDYTPQYRHCYSGSPIILEIGTSHTLINNELCLQESYNGDDWRYVTDTQISKYTYSSSDEEVATVTSSGGVITAKDQGSCVIYAKYGDVDSDFTTVLIEVKVVETVEPAAATPSVMQINNGSSANMYEPGDEIHLDSTNP